MENEHRETDSESSISRRMQAVIVLLIQSIATLSLAIFAFYVFSITEPNPADISIGIVGLAMTLYGSVAIITLVFAYSISSGNERKKWLRYWAGLCICYGLFYLLSLTTVTDFLPLFDLLLLITLYILLPLVPAGVILRFTGLSDRKREYQ